MDIFVKDFITTQNKLKTKLKNRVVSVVNIVKQICVVTCVFFTLSSSSVFASAISIDNTPRFPFFLDISPEHKDFDAVTYLHAHDMVNGYSDNTFLPDNKISRVESVKLLLEASKIPISSATNSTIFSDIPSGEWFSNYIYTAKKLGIINNRGEAGTGKFNPVRTVNKAEVIKMLLEVNNQNVRSALANEQWFYPYFEKANELHLFNKKYAKDELNVLYSYAGDNVTRGELSTYIYRYILTEFEGVENDVSVNNSTNLSADIFSDNSDSNPLSINALFSDGLLTLRWNADKFDSFVVHLVQKQKNNKTEEAVFNVTGNSITFATNDLKQFKSGLLGFVITKNSKTVARFNLPVYTKFTSYVGGDFVVNKDKTTYQYAFPNKKISAQIDIILEGSSDIDFSKYKLYVLTSSENLYEKPITSFSGSSLYVEFTPKIRDLYVIEIADEFGLAQAVIPVTPYGFFPILPNPLDGLESLITPSNSEVALSDSQVIQRINVLRRSKNISVLQEKEALTSLAKIRARDMKERHYLGHYTPEGLSVNDMRSDYSLTSPLSENLAVDSRGSAFATVSLEYSPTHRTTLLNKDLQFVGVATERLDDGSVLLVEVFQNTVLTSSDIESGGLMLYNYIINLFPEKKTDIVLQNASEDWSKIMGKKQKAQTEFSTGESWKNILDTYNITKSTGIFVLSHQNPEKMKEYFEENPEILSNFFENKASYGISLTVGEDGIVYLSLIGSE